MPTARSSPGAQTPRRISPRCSPACRPSCWACSSSRWPTRTSTTCAARRRAQDWPRPPRPESQDVCFLGGGELRGFLDRQGVDLRPGEIQDTDGAVVGHHTGAVAFTVGQRRGLGVAASEPQYVRSVDASAGIVTIAPLARLGRREVELIDATLHRPVSRVRARLRVHWRTWGRPSSRSGRGSGCISTNRSSRSRRARSPCSMTRRAWSWGAGTIATASRRFPRDTSGVRARRAAGAANRSGPSVP